MSEMKISDILAIGPEEIARGAGTPLEIVPDDAAISERFAAEMIGLIERNNRLGMPSSFILPVGPRGGYPVFVDGVRDESLDLSRTAFFFMDEYLDEEGRHISPDNPLSFRGFVREALIGPLSGSPGFDPGRVCFPDPQDTGAYARLMQHAGGIDLVLAGVGIDGHVAFNEPVPQMDAEAYAKLPTRIVDLTCETRTVNAAMEAGGAIDLVPRRAVTVGMAEIFSARRIVVFMNRGWQRAAVRRFLFGEITVGFPVSLLRGHADLSVIITVEVSQRPLL
ncbi:MAG: glucosamine-6-phosphate isomerase [Deltaproteobacteria bacterium]|nr:glucosamine-6-phosphate isomerase [Candidatus Zymogenaceae bacterium]